MAVKPVAELGTLQQTFDVDNAAIKGSRNMALIVAACMVGAFLFVAIVGPIQQRKLDNAEGAMIAQIFGYLLTVGSAALGILAAIRTTLALEGRVEVREQGIVLQSNRHIHAIRWDEIKQVEAIPPAFRLNAGLFGAALGNTLGTDGERLYVELQSGARVALPAAIVQQQVCSVQIDRNVRLAAGQ